MPARSCKLALIACSHISSPAAHAGLKQAEQITSTSPITSPLPRVTNQQNSRRITVIGARRPARERPAPVRAALFREQRLGPEASLGVRDQVEQIPLPFAPLAAGVPVDVRLAQRDTLAVQERLTIEGQPVGSALADRRVELDRSPPLIRVIVTHVPPLPVPVVGAEHARRLSHRGPPLAVQETQARLAVEVELEQRVPHPHITGCGVVDATDLIGGKTDP